MKKVSIFTDGACSPNPGTGGYGTVIQYKDESRNIIERELSGGYQLTTNNRMELMAVIVGVEALICPCEITITTDSKYVANPFTENWIKGWQLKHFKGIKNPDLWIRLIEALKSHKYQFVWVKGHAGHPENERCDRLAVLAAKSEEVFTDLEYEKIS